MAIEIKKIYDSAKVIYGNTTALAEAHGDDDYSEPDILDGDMKENKTDWLAAIEKIIEKLLNTTNEKYPEFEEMLAKMRGIDENVLTENQRYAFHVWNTCVTVQAYLDTMKYDE